MSKFKKFGEFLTEKVVKMDVKNGLAGEDYDGPLSIKPDQEPTDGKKDKPLPYKNAENEDGGFVYVADDSGDKKGLAAHGTPGMNPKASLGQLVKDKTKTPPKAKKVTTEEFIDSTKDLTDADFIQFISESHTDTTLSTVSDLFGNEFTPDPTQTIQYVTGLIMGNPLYLNRFVREVKRRGGVDLFMGEMLDHGETYDVLIDHMEDDDEGEERCQRFARHMNDRHMSFMDNFEFDDEMEESVGSPLPTLYPHREKKRPEQEPNEDQDMSGQSDDLDDESQEDDLGLDDSMGDTKDPDGDQSQQPAGGQTKPQFAHDGKPLEEPMPPKKMRDGGPGGPRFKGKGAAFRLMKNLGKYQHFQSYMKSL